MDTKQGLPWRCLNGGGRTETSLSLRYSVKSHLERPENSDALPNERTFSLKHFSARSFLDSPAIFSLVNPEAERERYSSSDKSITA